MLFLTTEELITLTGRKRPKAQIAQLQAQRIAFHLTARGMPVVPRSAIDQPQAPVVEEAPEWKPNIS